MTNQEKYEALMARLHAPENSGLRCKLSLIPNGYDLSFHLKRIRDYVNYQEQNTNVSKELSELDYIVSLRKANELMDEQGWK